MSKSPAEPPFLSNPVHKFKFEVNAFVNCYGAATGHCSYKNMTNM